MHRLSPRPAPLALAVLLTLAAGSALAQDGATSAQATLAFSISAKPLGQALNDWALQTQSQLIVQPGLVTGKTAPAVSGNLTPRQAIDRLLAGSGLVATQDGNAIVVRPAPAAASGDVQSLAPVTVTGERESAYGPGVGYVADRSAAGTKTDAPVLTTPQSISVVTREQMNDQQVQTFAEALRYSPGVVAEPYGLGTYDTNPNFFMRGFSDEYSMFVDGMSVNSGSVYDAYFFDRVEVVGGPASVLYGQGNPGGIVNMVSKRPTAEPLREVIVGLGNRKRRQISFDFSGPLNADATLMYRLTGTGVERDTQIDFNDFRQYAIAPALTWRPNARTSFTLSAKYIDTPRSLGGSGMPIYGTLWPNPNGKIPRSFNSANPDATGKFTYKTVGWNLDHAFSDNLKFHQNAMYNRNQTSNISVFGGDLLSDMRTLRRNFLMPSLGKEEFSTIDNHLIYKSEVGGVKGETLVGFDYRKTEYNGPYGWHNLGWTLDVFNPVYQPIDIDQMVAPNEWTPQHFGSTQKGFYAQHQLSAGVLTLIGSVRRDAFAGYNGETLREKKNKTTFRVGGSYLFANGLAPYISYSTSFKPQNGKNYLGEPFTPQEGKQTEIGLKYEAPENNLLLTAAIFDLSKTNVPTSDEDHPGFSRLVAGVRSRGLELSARGDVTRSLQLLATYSYNDVKNTSTNDTATGVADGIKVPIVGLHPTYVPKHAASLWASYRWANEALRGLTTSVGVRYKGSTWGDAANSYKVRANTLVDLTVAYDFGVANSRMKGWLAQFNVSNLFDKDAFSCSGTTCQYGPARSIYASLRYRW